MFQGINKFFDDLMKDLDKFCDGNSLCVFLIIMILGFLVCKYFNVSGFSSGDNNLMEKDSFKESDGPSPANSQQMEEYVPIGLKPSSRRPDKVPPSLESQMKLMGSPQPMMKGMQQKQQLLIQDGSIVRPFNEIWNPGFTPVDMMFQGAVALDKLGYGPMGKDRPMAPTLKQAEAPKLKGEKAAGAGGEATLVLLYAPWCGHSKKMLPDYEKVKSDYHGKEINGTTMNIVMYDSDVDKDKVKEYKVRGFPTLFYEKDGERQPFNPRDYDGIVAELERLNA